MSVLFLELLMGIFKMKLFASLSTMALLNCILTAVKIVLMIVSAAACQTRGGAQSLVVTINPECDGNLK